MRWEQWRGKVRRWMPLSLHKETTSIEICLSWLSNKSKTGFSLLGLTSFWKCYNEQTKFSEVIHPLRWAKPMHPGGPSWYVLSGALTLGKTKDGIVWPLADTKHSIVVFSPLSADRVCATCFAPFLAITFGAWKTMGTPVLSQFQILPGRNCNLLYSPWRLRKKAPVTVALKPAAQAWLVFYGFLMDKVALRFINTLNQSNPACSFSSQLGGNLSFRVIAHW